MNTNRPLGISVILVLAIFSGQAQSRYQFGLLPSLNFNKKLAQDFSLNAKVESRQELKDGFFNTPADFSYDYLLTDLSLLVAKKFRSNQSIGFGYLLRLEEGKTILRSIQQYTVTRAYSSFRLAHRLSTDQTFSAEEPAEYRLRYRIAAEIPLNGQTVDPREFYFKLNHEYLNAWQEGEYDLEIRAVPMLGYEFSDTQKLEIGLDYRLSSFLNDSSRQRFWVALNWFQTLGVIRF